MSARDRPPLGGGRSPTQHGHKKTSDRPLSETITVACRTWPSDASSRCPDGHIPSSRCRCRIERDLAPRRCNRLLIRMIRPAAPAVVAPMRAGRQTDGGDRRDRTDDLMLAKHALSQLSYVPDLVGLGRLERPTSPLSGVRSNHLSYRPRATQTPALGRSPVTRSG